MFKKNEFEIQEANQKSIMRKNIYNEELEKAKENHKSSSISKSLESNTSKTKTIHDSDDLDEDDEEDFETDQDDKNQQDSIEISTKNSIFKE